MRPWTLQSGALERRVRDPEGATVRVQDTRQEHLTTHLNRSWADQPPRGPTHPALGRKLTHELKSTAARKLDIEHRPWRDTARAGTATGLASRASRRLAWRNRGWVAGTGPEPVMPASGDQGGYNAAVGPKAS